MIIIAGIWFAGAVVTLVLLRACMVTRGSLQLRPEAYIVWLRQIGYALVWPLFWVVLQRAAANPDFRRWILGWA